MLLSSDSSFTRWDLTAWSQAVYSNGTPSDGIQTNENGPRQSCKSSKSWNTSSTHKRCTQPTLRQAFPTISIASLTYVSSRAVPCRSSARPSTVFLYSLPYNRPSDSNTSVRREQAYFRRMLGLQSSGVCRSCECPSPFFYGLQPLDCRWRA